MIPKATRTETLPRAQAEARLQQLGAAYQAERSTPTKYVYYAGVTKTWVVLEPYDRYRWKLSFYAACPC